MVEFLTTAEPNREFKLFLERLRKTGCSYELVVENGKITKLYVREQSSVESWSRLKFGRIIGSEIVSYIQAVYLPRLVDGKFIYNYNEKKERAQ